MRISEFIAHLERIKNENGDMEVNSVLLEQIEQDEKMRKFKAFLEEMSKTVKGWPTWKQNILGRIE